MIHSIQTINEMCEMFARNLFLKVFRFNETYKEINDFKEKLAWIEYDFLWSTELIYSDALQYISLYDYDEGVSPEVLAIMSEYVFNIYQKEGTFERGQGINDICSNYSELFSSYSILYLQSLPSSYLINILDDASLELYLLTNYLK